MISSCFWGPWSQIANLKMKVNEHAVEAESAKEGVNRLQQRVSELQGQLALKTEELSSIKQHVVSHRPLCLEIMPGDAECLESPAHEGALVHSVFTVITGESGGTVSFRDCDQRETC